MAFNYQSSRHGSSRNLTNRILIKTSDDVAVGDVVETFTTGTVENGTAGEPVKGIVHAIVDKDGLPFKKARPSAGTAYTSDTTSVTGDGTQYCLIDTSKDSLYSVAVSGNLGTTNDSDMVGGRIDVNSAGGAYGEVLETTNTRTIATVANFYNHGLDPLDSSRLIVSIAVTEEESPQA